MSGDLCSKCGATMPYDWCGWCQLCGHDGRQEHLGAVDMTGVFALTLNAAPKIVAPETPIGTPVRVRRDNGEILDTVTRSAPWDLGGRLVVQVKGISGCYLAERCEVLDAL